MDFEINITTTTLGSVSGQHIFTSNLLVVLVKAEPHKRQPEILEGLVAQNTKC